MYIYNGLFISMDLSTFILVFEADSLAESDQKKK